MNRDSKALLELLTLGEPLPREEKTPLHVSRTFT
jgi:hypothetical protein